MNFCPLRGNLVTRGGNLSPISGKTSFLYGKPVLANLTFRRSRVVSHVKWFLDPQLELKKEKSGKKSILGYI